jgi:hypothetical protein
MVPGVTIYMAYQRLLGGPASIEARDRERREVPRHRVPGRYRAGDHRGDRREKDAVPRMAAGVDEAGVRRIRPENRQQVGCRRTQTAPRLQQRLATKRRTCGGRGSAKALDRRRRGCRVEAHLLHRASDQRSVAASRNHVRVGAEHDVAKRSRCHRADLPAERPDRNGARQPANGAAPRSSGEDDATALGARARRADHARGRPVERDLYNDFANDANTLVPRDDRGQGVGQPDVVDGAVPRVEQAAGGRRERRLELGDRGLRPRSLGPSDQPFFGGRVAVGRVEVSSTVSEAVADAFENAKALLAEGSNNAPCGLRALAERRDCLGSTRPAPRHSDGRTGTSAFAPDPITTVLCGKRYGVQLRASLEGLPLPRLRAKTSRY